MPIIGLGTDIVETGRIRDLFDREEAFGRRVFTNAELEYSLSRRGKYLHLAARFAVKEAVAKALGRSFSWQDVEVVNAPNGRPSVRLYGRAKRAAGNAQVHISISHSKHYASAVAVVEETP